jgi:hypothetical protein
MRSTSARESPTPAERYTFYTSFRSHKGIYHFVPPLVRAAATVSPHRLRRFDITPIHDRKKQSTAHEPCVTLLDVSSLTLQFDASNLMEMIGKKIFLMAVVGALLLLQFADCMSAFSQDQKAMECCGTSACTPANQSHGCCKAMTSTEMPSMVVTARASLVPVVAVVEREPVLEAAMFTLQSSPSFEPQQYDPPELYTLHSSLLI